MTRSSELARLLLWAGTLLPACAHHSEPKTTEASASVVADGHDDREDVAYLRARLTTLRANRGLSPAQPFSVADGYLADAKKRILSGRSPAMALDDALQSAADEGERDLTYWALPAPELKTFAFPAALLQERDLHVAIAVIRRHNPAQRPEYDYYVLMAASASSLPQSGPAE